MSYDISFVSVGECNANITWNVREMIVRSTGLEWKNEQNNGLCKDVIPYIVNGYEELTKYPEKYKRYEAKNGWGTVQGCKKFFAQIIHDWNAFCEDYCTSELADVTYFWIE